MRADDKNKNNLRLKALQFKLKTAKSIQEFRAKLFPEKYNVPGVLPPVGMLVRLDYYNKKEPFVRYIRTTYEIDIQDDMKEENALKVFEEKFMPAWNDGKLDETYYKDDYEFIYKSQYYTQAWDNEKQRFKYRNHDSNEWQVNHPEKTDQLREKVKVAFDKFEIEIGIIEIEDLSDLAIAELEEPFTEEEIEEATKSLNVKKNGKVSFEDFLAWFIAGVDHIARTKRRKMTKSEVTMNILLDDYLWMTD